MNKNKKTIYAFISMKHNLWIKMVSMPLIFVFISCNKGLIAHFPFDSNANNLSSSSLNGFVEGATLSIDRNGNLNSAYYFDGVDDYIKVDGFGEVMPTEEISISMWIKSILPKGQFQLMLCPDKNRCAISVNFVHAKINSTFWDFGWRGEGGNAPGRLYFRPEPVDTLWHHYVFVSSISEKYMKIYKDNELLETKNEPRKLLGSQGKNLMIGSGDKAYFFKGYLDGIRIYNRAIKAKEIQKLFLEK